MRSAQHRHVALVTGARGAIGDGICCELDQRGYAVIGADLVGRPSTEARDWPIVELDVRSAVSCRSAVAEALARFGSLNVVVNCAGINARGLAEDMSEEAWRPVIDVNLLGTYRMCQAAFSALKDADGAAIVNFGSSAGLVAIPGAAIYGVSKAAISHLTKILAVEWAKHGVRVNAVAPTIVPSAMTADVLADEAYVAAKLASIPIGRMATVDDVAAAVAWLAGPESAMTTGLTVPVDGGVSVQ